MGNGKDQSAQRTRSYEVSRRDFLIAGTAAIGTLAHAMPASAGELGNGKSLIQIYLPGGPSHLDTFDMKPRAPRELRGEFRPIRTRIPGVEICELLPRLSRLADRFTLVRGITGLRDEHSPSAADSGWPAESLREIGGRPGLAAVLSTTLKSQTSQPASVDLTGWTSAGFLGDAAAVYEPVRPEPLKRRGQKRESTARPKRRFELALRQDQSIAGRKPLRIECPALDISRESARTINLYGIDSSKENARFLEARRLLEAGVRCVSLAWGYWDTHGNNFGQLRNQLPALDQGLSALIEDLESRGRLDETLILMSGEFGRTPEINNGAGRDHWAETAFAFLAGGGLPHGRVIGNTDREGRFPHEAVPIEAVTAGVYAGLGMDASRITLSDPRGRRHALIAHRGLSSALG